MVQQTLLLPVQRSAGYMHPADALTDLVVPVTILLLLQLRNLLDLMWPRDHQHMMPQDMLWQVSEESFAVSCVFQ